MATVRNTADTAIPIKPTRWRGLLPTRSTMNSCTGGQKVQRSDIQVSFTVNGSLETHGDHSEDGVDHAGTDRGVDGLGHTRSLEDPGRVVKHLQRRTLKQSSELLVVYICLLE